VKSIIVHGGAWDKGVPDEQVKANKAGVRRAALAGWEVLRRGAQPSRPWKPPSVCSKMTPVLMRVRAPF